MDLGSRKAVRERGGAVAGVEDEQRHRPAGVPGTVQAAQHALDLGDRLRGAGGRGGRCTSTAAAQAVRRWPVTAASWYSQPGVVLLEPLQWQAPGGHAPALGRTTRPAGDRTSRPPRPVPAASGRTCPGPGRRPPPAPRQGPVQQPAVDDVMPRDPGTALRPVHQRRQHLREQGEQPLVIDPPGRQRIVERAVPAPDSGSRDSCTSDLTGRSEHKTAFASSSSASARAVRHPRSRCRTPQRPERGVPRKDWQPGTRA